VIVERRAALRPETTPGETLAILVDGGEAVLAGEITVRGNRALTREEILARMELSPGKPFQEAALRRDVERILRAYSEKGFALARIYPSHFERDAEGRLSFVVRLSEGPKTEIETLRVFGDVETSERVIARVSGVRPGDPWNIRKIETMATRLRREGLFERVGEPRIVRGSRDNLIGLEIELEEGPSNSLLGVLGYNPDPKGGGDLVGMVDVDLRNILGTARRARIRFESQPGDVKDISFRFREPWILGSPISLEGGAAQARRDTLYSRTDLDLALSVPVRERAVMSVALERRQSSFDDAAGERVSETSTGGSVGFTLDTRDRRVNPSSGFAAGIRVGARETADGQLRTRLALDAHVLLPFARRWVASEEGGFRGVQTTGEEVPLYEQFFLGGTNTVRGYREEQFHGEKVFWLRSELRYRLSLRSRAYAFFDAGGYEFESEAISGGEARASDLVPGGGFGMALETRTSGIVRFELGLGRGDGFSDSKVHVGLEQEF
jgi:outer membrane protein insertion porin family